METWQRLLQASITKPGDLTRKYGIAPGPLEQVAEQYPMRVNPYYLSLIKAVDDPIWRQAVPSEMELQDTVCPADPLEEENQSPVPNLVHRYPDRALFLVCSEFQERIFRRFKRRINSCELFDFSSSCLLI